MSPTQQELEDANCWFDVDKAGGTEMTSFKRSARWHQHRWAVDAGITTFGTHPGRVVDPGAAPERIANGTKLADEDAEAGRNFLSTEIREVAEDRMLAKQAHETLDANRLRRDLLSSMPMAFNLFGQASLPQNTAARQRLAELFGVGEDGQSEIVFEWSPGRRSDRYTRDRTAFDVALLLGDPSGPRTVIGIETKYHEHSTREQIPSNSDPVARQRHEDQTSFLVRLAEKSGVFKSGWQEQVLTTDLRQIWRDHLLALSMRQQPEEWTDATRYALVYPSRNVSFSEAARRYAGLLVDGDASFLALTIEDVADAAFVDEGIGGDFRRRYLWWLDGN